MGLRRRLRLVGGSFNSVMTNSRLRIAFATNDMKHVNQHFGAARCMAIYAVDETRARLIEAAQFNEHHQGHNESKLTAKLDVLHRCAAVYCLAVGSSAISRLLAAGIQPVKAESNTPIKQIIAELQSQLSSTPPHWLRKAGGGGQAHELSRFDRMDVEGWDG